MYEAYLSPTSQQIYKQYTNILFNAIALLKKHGWKDGSKPQDNQLKAVMDATVALENLYEDHLTPHIKVIRFLKYKCPVTVEMVNGIQTLRKKEIIPLLKRYDSSLGHPVPTFSARRLTRPSPVSIAAKIDERFGLYGRDWVWAHIDGIFGKSTVFISDESLSYYVFDSKQVAERGGHSYFEERVDQQMFDEFFDMKQIGKPKAKPISASKPYSLSSGNITTVTANTISSVASTGTNIQYAKPEYNNYVTPDQLKAKYPKTEEEAVPNKEADIFRWEVPMPKDNNDPLIQAPKPKSSADKYMEWVESLHNSAKITKK